MRVIIISLLLIFGTLARGQEVKYVGIYPATVDGLNYNKRDTWDQTHQFCFTIGSEKEVKCYPLSQMGEVILRNRGQWNPSAQFYLGQLSPTLKDEAANKYDRIYVRYLAVGGSNEFLVHIFYVPKGGSENLDSSTIFAHGVHHLTGDVPTATITEMSFSQWAEWFGGTYYARAELQPSQFFDYSANGKIIVKQSSTLLAVANSVLTTYFTSSLPVTDFKKP